jgi:hypothetical protein
MGLVRLPRLWKDGAAPSAGGPVHVSMNDFLIHRSRDAPRVARAGMQLRAHWPAVEGSLGLWFAAYRLGRRQVSVSVWRSPDDLRRFVATDVHRRLMRDFRDAGVLHTNAWTTERFDRTAIWREAEDRLTGRVAGVSHH